MSRQRVASIALGFALGVAIGAGLGVVATPGSAVSISGAENPNAFASQSQLDDDARARGERIVAGVLAAAPECEPDIRMAGAPASEREEFLREARRLAAEAAEDQGLVNVVWRVIERDGRLYGVLYGERCD